MGSHWHLGREMNTQIFTCLMPQLWHFLGSLGMLGVKACAEEDAEMAHVCFSRVFTQTPLLLFPYLTGEPSFCYGSSGSYRVLGLPSSMLSQD